MDFSSYQFGNYQLTELLGNGGFADVYKAWDKNLHRWVAIKVPRNYLTSEQRAAFLKEARVMANMNHRHILPVLEFDTYRNIPYLVLPYAPSSLRDLHPHGTIVPSETIISYTWQVSYALFYIHQHGYVHLDVKPGNLLLGEDGRVLVSDFGIVTIMRNTGPQGNQGPIGTPSYMSPEQCLGGPCAASDQYSLAVTVYEWMTGRYLFTGTPQQVMWRHVNSRPSSTRMNRLGIPFPMQAVLLKALEKDPRDRYGTVLEFADALEHALRPPPPPEQEDERDEKLSVWEKLLLLFMGAVITPSALGGIAYLLGENVSIVLLIMQLGWLILPIPITAIWRNRLALKFALAIPVIAALVGVLSHSWLAFEWASPILLILFSWFGFLQTLIRRILPVQ